MWSYLGGLIMNIKCMIFGHKYSEWEYVKPIGRYEDKLKRKCKICGKYDTYTGLTNKIYEKREPIRK